MLTRVSIALCLVVLALALACGEDNPVKPRELGWSALGLEGSFIVDLELHWPYLYAGTAWDGLFRANVTHGEPKWELLGFAGKMCYAAKLLEDGTLLAISSSGVFRSEDIGRTWAASDSGLTGGELCITSCCDALISVAADGKVYKSGDTGLTWSQISQIHWSSSCHIACHPADCRFLLVSLDSWRYSYLLISRDAGETWTSVSPSQLHDYYSPRGVAFDPLDKHTAYVGTHGAVFKTSDSGATWTPIIEAEEDTWFNAVTHDPIRRYHIYAGGHGYVYLSPDGGDTIERIEVPVEEEITDVACGGKRRILFVGTEKGVYKYVY